jgi:hypothetical protein
MKGAAPLLYEAGFPIMADSPLSGRSAGAK